jgi:hypothetical protein
VKKTRKNKKLEPGFDSIKAGKALKRGRGNITMDAEVDRGNRKTMIASARSFLGDVASYAGSKGLVAAIFVLLSALLEGIGLAFLVPLLGIVIGSAVTQGRLQRAVDALLQHVFHAGRPLEKLTVIFVLFASRI